MQFTNKITRLFVIFMAALITTVCSSRMSLSQESIHQQVTKIVTHQSHNQNNWVFPIPSNIN
jgi:hypothetical protein